ncbi:MAG: sulfatase-like hydrolase/transferase [Pseudomonadales bacterium]|nr:sulfatase-like hydrolase/transferase [Pseudomonadales bacterium]
MNRKSIFSFSFCVLLTACSDNGTVSTNEALSQTGDETPNVILILADDLAFSDLGAYGSEIETPNLDELASSGVLFTRFHTSAMCSPSRAMLLTGVDQHKNGYGTMGAYLDESQRGQPGYEGYLNDQVVTVASLLNDAGFNTYMTGKWHLGTQTFPSERGFDRTFILLQGAGSHFDNTGYASAQPTVDYFRNGNPVELPDDFYSSDAYTDEMITYIEEGRASNQPFFGYLAFSAPHFPLHAPAELTDKYIERYMAGWDVIRQQRHNTMKELGLIDNAAEMAQRLERVPPWNEISLEEQRYQAKKMAVYAAMVDSLDQNVGKLVSYLKSIDEYDDTVFFFLSDNGPEAVDFTTYPILPVATDWIAESFNNSYENLGSAGSYSYYGERWAHVGAAAHSFHKTVISQGGINVPLIVSYAKALPQNRVVSDFSSVVDITPTILELANVTHPGNAFNNRAIHSMDGRSVLPYLRGTANSIYPAGEGNGFELFGHNAYIIGNWKITRLQVPYGDFTWGLYDLDKDPAELNNLAEQNPEKFQELLAAYAEYAERNGVIQVPEGWRMFENLGSSQ